MSLKLAMAGAILASVAIASADESLKIGSPAPAVKVAKWIKGKPVEKFAPGKVYVVEFWATWCGPCKVSIPHLTELAHKYKDKATFVGVSAFEVKEPKDEAYIANVEKFVTEYGDKMDYNVAADGKEGWMATNWMQAAQQGGIPTAFVVDQKGSVVWIGHPMMGLDEVVGQVIEGKFDAAAEAKRMEEAKAKEAEAMKAIKPFLEPYQKKDYATAVKEADKAFAADPKLETTFGMLKYQSLALMGSADTAAYARKLAKEIYKGDPNAMNSMAWFLVDDASKVQNPDYKLAVELAEIGVAGLKPEQFMESAYLLDTLAYAYFKNGQVDKAIATQEKALAAAAKATEFPAQTKTEMEERLAKFKAKKG